jgi:hypothetical protein
MLLTKYKVQELVENAKIDLDDLSQNVGVFLEGGIDDDRITLVYAAIDMLKEQIIDELGRDIMIDRDNLYQAEMCASDRSPSLYWGDWGSLDNAMDEYDQLRKATLMRKDIDSSGMEVRLWSYDKRKQQITLIQVDKG